MNPSRAATFIFLLLIVFIGFQSVVYAEGKKNDLLEIIEQGKRDTARVNALIELYQIESTLDHEKARLYLDQAFPLAHNLGYKKGKARILVLYGDYYKSMGKYDLAVDLINKGRLLYEEINDQEGMALAFNSLGLVAYIQGDLKIALGYFHESVRFYETVGDTFGIVVAQHNMGGVHYDQGRYDKALEYWEKNLEMEMDRKDTVSVIYSLQGIGIVHYAKKDYEKGSEVMKLSLKLAREVESLTQVASLLMNIGGQYHEMGQLDSAESYYVQSLELYKQFENKEELTMQYINLGSLENNLNNGQLAKAYFDTSLVIAKEMEAPHLMKGAYKGLAEANKVLGNYEEAFEWLYKWHNLRDSLSGEKVKLELNALQEKFEASQKDKEIAELESKKANAVSVAERQRTVLVITIITVLAIFLVLIFYIGRRRAKERQRQTELEQKALRSQMNPHFIFNSLGAIQQMYMSGEMDLANNYLGDFGTLMRMILDNSGKESISVKEELQMLDLYLELEKGRGNGLIDFHIEVDERIDKTGAFLPPMVIQPFIENAIWHGLLPKRKKGNVWIKLELIEDKNQLQCKVMDDGVGMKDRTVRKDHEPKGMKITEQRIGTKILVSDLNPGTQVTINIPL